MKLQFILKNYPWCCKEIEISFLVKFWIKKQDGKTAFKSKFSQQQILGNKRYLS